MGPLPELHAKPEVTPMTRTLVAVVACLLVAPPQAQATSAPAKIDFEVVSRLLAASSEAEGPIC